ncbi:tRNA (adenosine(37)-N6)-threonylcarbamoyltransferase complex dimerization subunit type 1 TsaB [Paenibacillus sacheonensis]|uniref:tRNA (Adenosine(37)-N6)-threonylcarbamoyltransferase complex dimerization subunit type 1 TsaB n=1 Tax=Paenibacillus sacheonensis TaxID=742054 RepID=A0A7X4YPF5_9BACL|nr:tRNA (adenosine(37)-N6)-threonylcarbamoyltransferase complex dimerization subunit type 1 TsaB [Paenibacillus sacheonensis]MBM7565158.1 tRNA threonylcarbamoyladenosine biosynthesis protein TsaB [Paenibacillus sacheonensis]NBC70062.1 tRNA (adenosine(37)-N6)-threonylcarbamoyltransferase complex dimerization subunit type 1 TsaB [Paenibacillus sacheonensis]
MGEHTTEGGPDGLLVLAVDTSTAALAAALTRGGEVLKEVLSLAERNHSVHTVSTVQTMLAECGVKPEELDGIAIGRGPGSYTGMRIAVSLGKTLAWVWNKPLVGVSSLEALAYGARQQDNRENGDGSISEAADRLAAANKQAVSQLPRSDQNATGPVWVVPIMDARRGQVYTASFETGTAVREGAWKRLAKDGIRLMHDWVDELAADVDASDAAQRPAAIWIAGELEKHEAEVDRLQAICPGVQVRKLPVWLEGRAVAALGAARLAAGESDDVHAFTPNYTQLTEAEVKLQERTAKQAAAEGAVSDDAH